MQTFEFESMDAERQQYSSIWTKHYVDGVYFESSGNYELSLVDYEDIFSRWFIDRLTPRRR